MLLSVVSDDLTAYMLGNTMPPLSPYQIQQFRLSPSDPLGFPMMGHLVE